MKTVFLDFDGVLFDTAKEAYLLTRCAYDDISPLEPINQAEYVLFHKYRYLITKSWHFYYIIQLIKENTSELEFETKYYNFITNYDKTKVQDFDEKYILAREKLIKENYEFWDNLDNPYPFFYNIKELAKNSRYKFIILTNKKYLPVSNKLKKYNLEIDIYANDDLRNFASKGEFINNYMLKNQISSSILIEDSSVNIKSCMCYNIVCCLVNWGYISPDEKGLELKQVIEILEA